ncbi:MAG: 4-hydroxy-4-methyl-2-oxoglutarate aldolase [Aromatoleum sp.]|nr:4-hydroxy-4-methyl-2-oxoglutarate aldolase [Aromatoleum sp.]
MPEQRFRSPYQGVIKKTFERPPAHVVAAIATCYTGFIIDRTGKQGFMNPAVKPIAPGMKMCGPATTVLGADLEVRRMAINLAQPGDVLVCAADGVVDYASFGDITALRMQLKGMSGIVIDGATRDAAVIREMGFPVFVKGITARNYHYPYAGDHGGVNVPVVCAGVLVNAGDIVLGDDDGVVVVPREMAIGIARTVEAEFQDENVRKRGLTAWQPWPIEDVLRERGYRFED